MCEVSCQPPISPLLRVACVCALVGFLAACDLFAGSDGGPLTVSGRVVLAETGEPLAGVGITFTTAGIVQVLVDSARTDADGRFSLRHDSTRPRGTATSGTCYAVTVNDGPYDSRYTTFFTAPCEAGGFNFDLGTVELRLNDAP